jgi:hypothetical protein
MARSGAYPVPPPIMMAWRGESPRNQNCPSGPSMRSRVPARIVSNSCPVKPLDEARRTCTSSSLPSAGALASEKLRRRPSERMKSMYCPARYGRSSTAGRRRNTAMTSSASRSMRSMRLGRLLTSTSGAGRISRVSTVRSVTARAWHNSTSPSAASPAVMPAGSSRAG